MVHSIHSKATLSFKLISLNILDKVFFFVKQSSHYWNFKCKCFFLGVNILTLIALIIIIILFITTEFTYYWISNYLISTTLTVTANILSLCVSCQQVQTSVWWLLSVCPLLLLSVQKTLSSCGCRSLRVIGQKVIQSVWWHKLFRPSGGTSGDELRWNQNVVKVLLKASVAFWGESTVSMLARHVHEEFSTVFIGDAPWRLIEQIWWKSSNISIFLNFHPWTLWSAMKQSSVSFHRIWICPSTLAYSKILYFQPWIKMVLIIFRQNSGNFNPKTPFSHTLANVEKHWTSSSCPGADRVEDADQDSVWLKQQLQTSAVPHCCPQSLQAALQLVNIQVLAFTQASALPWRVYLYTHTRYGDSDSTLVLGELLYTGETNQRTGSEGGVAEVKEVKVTLRQQPRDERALKGVCSILTTVLHTLASEKHDLSWITWSTSQWWIFFFLKWRRNNKRDRTDRRQRNTLVEMIKSSSECIWFAINTLCFCCELKVLVFTCCSIFNSPTTDCVYTLKYNFFF